jgi:hypothetical protein
MGQAGIAFWPSPARFAPDQIFPGDPNPAQVYFNDDQLAKHRLL